MIVIAFMGTSCVELSTEIGLARINHVEISADTDVWVLEVFEYRGMGPN